jgi:hypothetical protein
VLEEPLDALNNSCYDKDNDVIDDIDEFICIGRCKWDVIYHDADPIYDIEGHFQLFCLHQPHVIATNLDVWQHKEDMITDLFQPPRDELSLCSHDPGGFDTYSFGHLDLFYEANFQPPLCSNFDKGKDMVCLEQDVSDESFQPPLLLPCHSTINMVGNFYHHNHSLVGQICFQSMTCHEDFRFHTYDQQALCWEQFFFSRLVQPLYFLFLLQWVALESSICSFPSILLA